VQVTDWQDLMVAGRLVLSQITEAIDQSALPIFDVTTLNPNVLFELGYAIGSRRRVWILLDTSDDAAMKRWKQFQLLAPIGYTSWTSADDVRARFLELSAHLVEATLFEDLIEPQLEPSIPSSTFPPTMRLLRGPGYEGVHAGPVSAAAAGLGLLCECSHF
jgi:hypothetical protein